MMVNISGVRSIRAALTPVVEITSGKTRGSTSGSVHAFKGIPYGAPTSGRNRFMPPRKPEAWPGVREASAWAGHAPQAPGSLKQRPELADLSGPRDTVPESEDCLTLNVWTRGLGDGIKRPVMAWFHGGAFSYGSANTPRLDGSNLAERYDVVVVSVNQGSTSWVICTSPRSAEPTSQTLAMPAPSTCWRPCNGCATTSRTSAAIPRA